MQNFQWKITCPENEMAKLKQFEIFDIKKGCNFSKSKLTFANAKQ